MDQQIELQRLTDEQCPRASVTCAQQPPTCDLRSVPRQQQPPMVSLEPVLDKEKDFLKTIINLDEDLLKTTNILNRQDEMRMTSEQSAYGLQLTSAPFSSSASASTSGSQLDSHISSGFPQPGVPSSTPVDVQEYAGDLPKYKFEVADHPAPFFSYVDESALTELNLPDVSPLPSQVCPPRPINLSAAAFRTAFNTISGDAIVPNLHTSDPLTSDPLTSAPFIWDLLASTHQLIISIWVRYWQQLRNSQFKAHSISAANHRIRTTAVFYCEWNPLCHAIRVRVRVRAHG